MIKRIFIIILIVFEGALFASAQDTYVVQQFGNSLSNWASGRNTFSALETMEKLCSKHPAIRIGDNIMASLAYKNGLAHSKDYTWDNYITCMQKEVDKGVEISLSNIEQVPKYLIPSNYQRRKDLRFVSCNFHVSGASSFHENDLFVLVDGKIAKIQEYQVKVDNKGRRRLHVDLSDLELDEDTEGIGLTYNYSKAFPLGASLYYSKWKFMVSLDFGVNFDKDIYTTQKVEFNNLMDYKITRGEYDPKYYITATPSFYLKYFSIGWGVGILSMKGSEYTDQRYYRVDEDGFASAVTTGSRSEGLEKFKFMMRPNVRGFIPCSDNFFIALSGSYNWIPGYKAKSGIDFGVGFHYLFD